MRGKENSKKTPHLISFSSLEDRWRSWMTCDIKIFIVMHTGTIGVSFVVSLARVL